MEDIRLPNHVREAIERRWAAKLALGARLTQSKPAMPANRRPVAPYAVMSHPPEQPRSSA